MNPSPFYPSSSSPMAIALGLHNRLAGFPFLRLERYEVATISNVSFNVAEGTPQLYNKLEAQYVKIRTHSRDVNLSSK